MISVREFRIILLAIATLGELLGAPKFVLQRWQMSDGLPSDTIRNVVQTRDGYLWVATFNGLARFDGAEFKVFHLANTPSLRNNLINRLFEDREGRLWIGHDTGEVTVYVAGEFRAVGMEADRPRTAVERFTQIADGTVWMLYRNGWLRAFHHGTVGPVIRPSGARIVSMVSDTDGTVWIVKGDTVVKMTDGEDLRWSAGCPPQDLQSPRILAARRGGIWVLSAGWIRRWHQGQWAEEWAPSDGVGSNIGPLIETSTGLLLFAGVQISGVKAMLPDGNVDSIEAGPDTFSEWARCLWEDSEGSLWLGSGGSGLYRLRPRLVEMVNPNDHWKNRPVLSVTNRAAGGLWIGTEGVGIYRHEKGEFVHVSKNQPLQSQVIHSVLEDRKGTLWIGSSGGGGVLQVFDGAAFRVAVRDTALTQTSSLWETREGELWIGTQQGPARLQGRKLEWPAAGFGVDLSNTRCFAEDADGAVWIGTLGNGIARFQAGQVRQWRSADGLPSDYILAMSAEPDGSVWMGTYHHGLIRYRNGRFASVSTLHGLPSDTIFGMVDDGRGNFWMSSPAGIVRVAKMALDQCADGTLDRIPCLVLDTSDGLSTLDMVGGNQPASCRTPDGHLWFATAKGLAEVDPSAMRVRSRPTPVSIDALRVDGRAVKLPRALPAGLAGEEKNLIDLLLGPGVRHLEIEYAALSLVAPGRVRFQHKLEGVEDNLTDAGTRRVAFYNHLAPGDYVFRVFASNDDGVWNPDGATLAFRVRPFFWQTGWFVAVTFAIGVSAVGGVVYWVVRRRYWRTLVVLKQRQAIERERARIAHDIHDDLGAGLTQATLLAHTAKGVVQDPRQTTGRLVELQGVLRRMTQAMDEIVWAVNPQHDSLDSLVAYLGKFAQDFLGSAGIKCVLDLALELPAWALTTEVRHGVFLAFKEALHNAVKHAGATEVHVVLVVAPDGFSLQVKDNGLGIANTRSSEKLVEGRIASGVGLEGMRQRLEQIGGEMRVTESLGGGTAVELVISRERKKAEGAVARAPLSGVAHDKTVTKTT